MIKTFLSALSVILFSIPIITYSFFPSSNLNIWLSTQPILAQIYAFPLATATMAAILSFLFFFLSFYKKNKQIRFYSGILLLLSLILLLFGTDKTLSSASNKTKTLKLVTWNVANQIEAQHLERIFSHFDADMAIFPELATNIRGEQENQRVKLLFHQVGLSMANYDIFTSPPTNSGIAPGTVIVKKSYGFYTEAKTFHTTRFGTIVLHSRKQNIPDIIALHTAPPLPGLMEIWKQDLNIIHNQLASKYPKAIIAGDFNATMRHGALAKISSHRDALNVLPPFERGTWNSQSPKLFNATIDHILLPKNHYYVKDLDIVSFQNSDHRCIFTEITF
ncbi:endonuclease/exonuclease/phosphatase family [Streptococcus pneumoniae]|nr:endonuclease/exonuclease/phosphatase family [Streptococcus pneumoniae]